jgi:hypothetical protein
MDILKRIDHAQQFCKFYADGAYSVEKEKWNYHVTPKFIEDIRQYIESLQLKLMHLQKQQAEPVISAWSLREVYFDEDGEPLMHRSPPAAQRTWVGLEIEEVQDSYNSDYQAQTRAVEAKLKERNT